MNKKTWKESGDVCPKCGQDTQILSDNEFEYAEKCDNCKWIIYFPKG